VRKKFVGPHFETLQYAQSSGLNLSSAWLVGVALQPCCGAERSWTWSGDRHVQLYTDGRV